MKVRRMIVIEHYNTVSWIQTIERDIFCLFLHADTSKTLARLLIFGGPTFNHMLMTSYVVLVPELHNIFLSVHVLTVLCLSRFSVLRQRQTPLLQRLRRSALMLRHQPTRHSRQRTKEGTYYYKLLILFTGIHLLFPEAKIP